jgi:hypothetical protein
MDLKSVESLMRLHQEIARSLPDAVSGISTPSRKEPELAAAEVDAMRSFLEERARLVSDARDRANAGFDAEIEVLRQAIAGVAAQPGKGVKTEVALVRELPKPARSRKTKRPPTP